MRNESHALHPRKLNVLIVEDSENDALLLELELQRAGYQTRCHRVESFEGLNAALDQESWDVIVADYVLPHFNGVAALALVKEKGLDLPFIIVSGHITDQTAVAAMKAGAHDYLMKDNLARLGSAVERELREADVRREQRRSQQVLQAEQNFRAAIENSVPSGITAVDFSGKQTYVNPAFCAMVGWKEEDLIGARAPFMYWPEEERANIGEALARMLVSPSSSAGVELPFRRRNGERFSALVQTTPLRDAAGNVTGWVSSVSDITERKRAERRIAAEHSITRILAGAETLDEAVPAILQVLLGALEADVGAFWLLPPHAKKLSLSAMGARTSSPALERFMAEAKKLTFTRGQNLPGRAWQEQRPVWVPDIFAEPEMLRRDTAEQANLLSAVAFPVQDGGIFFGVLELFAERPVHRESTLQEDPTLQNMLLSIGSELSQFIQRRLAEAALRKAHDELEMRVQQRTADLKLANEKLQMSIRERQRLEHELLDITEKERRRIGLDLHDDLGQRLSGIALMTKGLQIRLAKQQPEASEDAGKVHDLVQEAINHARELARDLATFDLKQKDLASALKDLAEHVRKTFNISCTFKADGIPPSLEPHAVVQFYKIAQEAVTNAIKHGKADRVGIKVANGDGHLVLTIQNNGKPFPDMRSRSTGMGLRIMNYRANLLGASLDVKAKGPDGTLVTCSLPLKEEKP